MQHDENAMVEAAAEQSLCSIVGSCSAHIVRLISDRCQIRQPGSSCLWDQAPQVFTNA